MTPRKRRVILTIEIETTAPIRELRRPGALALSLRGHGDPPPLLVVQVQANTVQPS
jgi:hypothetical protein